VSTGTLACPRCGTALVSLREPQGLVFECAECAGHAEGVSVLRKRLEGDAVNELWQRALSVRARRGLPCPSCRWPMAEVAFQAEEREAVVDACDRCLFVWFDAKEREALPSRIDVPAPLSPEAAEAVVRFEARRETAVWAPDARGEASAPTLPRGSSLPMDADDEVRPWLTWVLAVAVFAGPMVATFTGAEAPVEGYWARWLRGSVEWGFVPVDPWRHGGLTLLSSTLLATSRFSLFFSILFLIWIARRVERRSGRLWLLGLFVLGSVAGCLGYWVSAPRSPIPSVGAAGAITALYAWCLVAFPLAKVPSTTVPARPKRDPTLARLARWWSRAAEWRAEVTGASVAWAVFHWLDVQLFTWSEVVEAAGFFGGAVAGAACGLARRRFLRPAP
jgi:membrane associated rhomboid family serine protease/Zn-finger nucleic acid-binding protein